MNQIPVRAAHKWYGFNSMYVPTAVDTPCPQCGHLSALTFSPTGHDSACNIITGLARCSRCQQSSVLVVVEPSKSPNGTASELLIHPTRAIHRASVLDRADVDKRIVACYQAAIDSYNAGIWSGSVTQCRRTLEGIVKLMLPEDKRSRGTLAQQLVLLPDHADLAQPLLQLAEVLKEGGNVGAHFDLEQEPDQEFATLMMDLIDYILEYLYVMPGYSGRLRARLEQVNR